MLLEYPFLVVFFSNENSKSYCIGDCRGTGLPRQVFNKEHFTKDIFNSKEGKRCDYCHVILEDSIMDKIPNPAVGEQMWLDNALLNRNKKYI